MFRIVKPASRLQSRYQGGSRLYRTIRHYSKEHQNQLCPPPPPKKTNTGTAVTFGALALIGGATIGYAKYDPDFRCYLVEYVPFTDGLIKFVFQEEKSYLANIKDFFDGLKESWFAEGSSKHKRKQIVETPKEYKPPPPVFPSVAKDNKEPEATYSEIRLESKAKEGAEPDCEIVDQKPPDSDLPATHPKNLVELESQINEAASETVQAYNKATFALKRYINDVDVIIEDSVDQVDPTIWNSLKEKTRAKEEDIKNAEKEASVALSKVHKLKDILARPDFEIPNTTKDQANRNMTQVMKDIENAKKELEQEKKMANVTERYWKKVEVARGHFSEELEILFPTLNIKEKKLNIAAGDLDLFVLHAMTKVLYYQKELHKLETVGTERLKFAVEAARRGGLEVLTTEQICNELDKEKRKLSTEYHTKCLALQEASERELRNQLKLQTQAFTDTLNDAVKTRELEVERELTRTFDEQLTEERCKYKIEVAGMIGRLRGLDQALRARSEADKSAHQAQVLWSACQALFRSIKAGCPGLPWSEQLRPLDPEITAVKKAAADNDELVKAVLSGIPKVANDRGVYPEDALRERFIKVERMARQLALVPEGGGRLHMYFLSLLQSMLILKAASPIPQSELNDEQTDFSKLSTNEILQRAQYWIDRGDFAQTLRYMNLLKGASRAVSRQWMEEARVLLETQQAANTLMAHAAASGLLYL